MCSTDFLRKSPSLSGLSGRGGQRPATAGEGELIFAIGVGTQPSPRFTRPSRGRVTKPGDPSGRVANPDRLFGEGT